MKLERLEGQVGDLADEVSFLVGRYDCWVILEPGDQSRRFVEKIDLVGRVGRRLAQKLISTRRLAGSDIPSEAEGRGSSTFGVTMIARAGTPSLIS